MYVADALELRAGDRGRLDSLTRSSSVRDGLATRARIVLLAADGRAERPRSRRAPEPRDLLTVRRWRRRYGDSRGSTGCSRSRGPGARRRPTSLARPTGGKQVARQGDSAPPRLGRRSHWSARVAWPSGWQASFAAAASSASGAGADIQPHLSGDLQGSPRDPELRRQAAATWSGSTLDPPDGCAGRSAWTRRAKFRRSTAPNPVCP